MDKSQRKKGTWRNLETAVTILKREENRKDNYDIPGVTKVVITPIVQKAIGCVVGEDVTIDDPCIFIKKETLEGDIQSSEKSVFLPVKQEIIEYPEKDVLLVLDTKAKRKEDFFVCVTTTAKQSILHVIEKEKDQLQLQLQNLIEKTPKKWKSQGSELEIDETQPRNMRSLIEIESSAKWPMSNTKVRFSMRLAEDIKDGYVELRSIRDPPGHIYRRKVDVATQVAAEVTTHEAQTNPSYPKTAWVQYKFDYCLKESPQREQNLLNFLKGNLAEFDNNIRVNESINFFTDDYGDLVRRSHSKIEIPRQDLISFQNVISSRNKSVAAVTWHPQISGLIAAAYSRVSCNEIYSSETLINSNLEDGQNICLIWSYTNHLKPILYLQAHRSVKCISFCPYNPNIIIGGCTNGQVVLWDITEALKSCNKTESLTEKEQKHRVIIYSYMHWLKNVQDIPVMKTVAVSHIDFSHKLAVNDITWMPSNYEVKPNGYIVPYEKVNLQFITCSEDSAVFLWDLKTEPELELLSEVKHSTRLKQIPVTLTKFESEFAKYNTTLIPHFKFHINDPELGTDIPLNKIVTCPQKLNYFPINNSLSKSTCFNLEIDEKPWVFPPKFILTSNTGQILKHTWQSYEIDPEAEFVETFGTTKCISIHDGPIDTCLRNPFIPELLLTVGGRIFAIWNELSDEPTPIVWRKTNLRYLNGTWSSRHPGIIIMFRSDSHFEIWDMLEQNKSPDYVVKYTGNLIVDAFSETDKNHVRQDTYCTVDNSGAIKIYKVPNTKQVEEDSIEHAKNIYFDHENRRSSLKQWTVQWKTKYYSRIDKSGDKISDDKFRTETRLDDLSVFKSAMRSDKFVNVDIENAKKWNTKQYDYMYKILIDKRKLDLIEIEKRTQPLIQAEEEATTLKEKEKQMLSSKDEIFNKTRNLLCEKTLINPRRDIKVSVAHLKASYYKSFKKLETNTLEYIGANTYQYNFNWNRMMNEGLERRKVFNTCVKENLHRKRWASKKEDQKEEIKKLEETSQIEKLKKNVQDIILIKKHIAGISG